MKNLKNYVIPIAVGALAFGGVALASIHVQGTDDNPTVLICHRTNSVLNPYLEQNVHIPNSHNGHEKHTGPLATSQEVAKNLKDAKTKWGDIIPPSDDFAGLNWTTQGQAILANKCKVPKEEPTPVVTPTTTPDNNTSTNPPAGGQGSGGELPATGASF